LTKEFPNFGRHGPLWESSPSSHTLANIAEETSERKRLEEFVELVKRGREGGESEEKRTSEKGTKVCRKVSRSSLQRSGLIHLITSLYRRHVSAVRRR